MKQFEDARAAFKKVCDEIEQKGYVIHGKHRLAHMAISQTGAVKDEPKGGSEKSHASTAVKP